MKVKMDLTLNTNARGLLAHTEACVSVCAALHVCESLENQSLLNNQLRGALRNHFSPGPQKHSMTISQPGRGCDRM